MVGGRAPKHVEHQVSEPDHLDRAVAVQVRWRSRRLRPTARPRSLWVASAKVVCVRPGDGRGV